MRRFRPDSLFRREVRRLEPYRVTNPPHRIKLNQNESPVELPGRVKRAIASSLVGERWAHYPDFPPRAVAARIARHLDLPAETVLPGHGSNELIYATVLVTVGKGETMLMPTPSYLLARLPARVAGGRTVTVPLGRRFEYEPDRIVRAIQRANPKLVFLPSPNNPTGTSLTEKAVHQIARSAPHSLVLIDEAYQEFSDTDLAPLVRQHSNLVLLRTLSKAFRLAGFRIGYLLGSPELLARIELGKPPHSVDRLSQVAVPAVLESYEVIQKGVRRVVRERERVSRALSNITGVDVFPSQANFLLFRVPVGSQAYEGLLSRGILVRNVGEGAGADKRLAGCLRVTIGTKKENDAFLSALSAHLKERT